VREDTSGVLRSCGSPRSAILRCCCCRRSRSTDEAGERSEGDGDGGNVAGCVCRAAFYRLDQARSCPVSGSERERVDLVLLHLFPLVFRQVLSPTLKQRAERSRWARWIQGRTLCVSSASPPSSSSSSPSALKTDPSSPRAAQFTAGARRNDLRRCLEDLRPRSASMQAPRHRLGATQVEVHRNHHPQRSQGPPEPARDGSPSSAVHPDPGVR
jgi:hypothetical protein